MSTIAPTTKTVELPIAGMDCNECSQHVQQALAAVPGVASANVLLATEKAIITLDPLRVDMADLRRAVERAGYHVPDTLPIPGGMHTVEVPVSGMDCVECTQHVQRAITALPGVESVNVLLSSEKAVVRFDPSQVDLHAIRTAVEGAGYTVPDGALMPTRDVAHTRSAPLDFTRQILTLFGLVFGAVLLIVVVGEWLGFSSR